jgi:ElaB/YqjD/DUF883 family membrane-anchored ribosome-binding protein
MTSTNKTTMQSDDGIGQRIEHAGERFVQIKDDVAKNLGTRVRSMGALIKDHPFAAAGIALGIGYLTARIIHR